MNIREYEEAYPEYYRELIEEFMRILLIESDWSLDWDPASEIVERGKGTELYEYASAIVKASNAAIVERAKAVRKLLTMLPDEITSMIRQREPRTMQVIDNLRLRGLI